jgi:hypothetical protein
VEPTLANQQHFGPNAYREYLIAPYPYARDTRYEGHMVRDEVCVCGHPQSLHRTYGCNGSKPNLDPKKTERVFCQCKAFQAQKAAHA